MPLNQAIMRHGRLGAAASVLVLLAGCLQPPAMLKMGNSLAPTPQEHTLGAQGAPSAVISELQARNSILPPNGSYAQLAEAVVTASSGAAAAELRVAQLKAEAKSKNWLPQIGPSVSLTSLSGLVSSLTLSQGLIDNGRRKAERDFAAADVEVAAVGLSAAMNQRVFEGLGYYVQAERARAQAAVSQRAAGRLAGFEQSMATRVEGGLSDMSEKQVISQRYAEMQATVAGDQDAARNALAQASALIGGPVDGLTGLDTLGTISSGPTPLAVLRKRGEGARSLAQANLSRADMLPGLTASADTDGTDVNPGLRLTGMGILNAGSSATMQAIAQTATVVDRQNAEAAEAAQRRLMTLSGEIDTLRGREAQGANVLAKTEGNLDLFNEQYKMGRRSLLELVSQYDAFARLERDQVSLRYEIALRQLEMARDLGVLVDGSRL